LSKIEDILEKKTLSKQDKEYLATYEPNEGQDALYSFFTPIWLAKIIYNLAIRYGFNEKTGKILEPSAGTGNFLEVAKYPKNVTAFELNNLNYKIAKKRVPEVKYFYNNYFETAFLKPERYTQKLGKQVTWLNDYPFDLVIGNPPYGKYKNLYSGYFKNLKFKQTEQFFIYQGLKLLKKGGILAYIIPSGFLRNDYRFEKKRIGELAEFVDAYRLPKVFKNTEIPTDIIILKRI